jgi:hypothetical protein
MIHRIYTNGRDVMMMAFGDDGAELHTWHPTYKSKTDLFYTENSYMFSDKGYKVVSINSIPKDAKEALVRTMFDVDEPSSAEIPPIIGWMTKYL